MFPAFEESSSFAFAAPAPVDVIRRQSTILHLQPNDIVCSRNSLVHKNPGNKRYTALIQAHQEAYERAASRSERMAIRRKIVQEIQAYGGRFVKFCSETETWTQLSEKDIRDKVAHALRGPNKMSKAKVAKTELLKREESTDSIETVEPLEHNNNNNNSTFSTMAPPMEQLSLLSAFAFEAPKPMEATKDVYGYNNDDLDQPQRRLSSAQKLSATLRSRKASVRRSFHRAPSFRCSVLMRQDILELPLDFEDDVHQFDNNDDTALADEDLAAIHQAVSFLGGHSQ